MDDQRAMSNIRAPLNLQMTTLLSPISWFFFCNIPLYIPALGVFGCRPCQGCRGYDEKQSVAGTICIRIECCCVCRDRGRIGDVFE